MKRTLNVVLGLLLVTTLAVAAPVAADDDPPEDPEVCVVVSVFPPGLVVDPWCSWPSGDPPEP